jgi:hypothetical protein
MLLAYFGTAPPEAYGIHAIRWDSVDQQQVARCDWIAVSATYLVGLYLLEDPFREFRTLRPDARAASTFFLYDLARPEVSSALRVARRRVAVATGGRTY